MRETIHPVYIAVGIFGALFIAYNAGQYVVEQDKKAQASRARSQTPPAVVELSGVATEPAPRVVAPPPRQYNPPPVQEVEVPPTTREIYLCKDYGGGMFWSSAICSTQRASIDRIVTVPGTLSWDQQVALAEGQKRVAEQLYVAPDARGTSAGNATPGGNNATACAALDEHIKQLDAMARQPQGPQMQDWIRQQRQEARTRQVALRC
jgi:hypothetical protein